MKEIRTDNDGRAMVMDLDDIEGLLRQVDVMVGVGGLTTLPGFADAGEVTVAGGQVSAASGCGDQQETALDGLDAFATLVPPAHFFKRVELTLPDREGVRLHLHGLRKCTERNAMVLFEGVEAPARLTRFIGIPVLPGQVFARELTLDAEGREVAEEDVQAKNSADAPVIVDWHEARIETGAHVVLAAGEYRAERYGYLMLADNCFSVMAPFFVSHDRLQVHWGIFSQDALGLTPAMLQPWFEEIGIKAEFLDVEKVERLLRALATGGQQRGAFAVAMGKKPVDGIDGRVKLLVPMERPVGIERPDGSVDFREVNYLPNVAKGQLVAHHILPVPGTPGMDVTGAVIPSAGGAAVPLTIDKTIRIVKNAAVELCYADQSGVVRFDGQMLAVVNILNLLAGVNYETGNITFAGNVFVKGTVAEGFSIHADGDVTVTETVSEGAEIVSRNGGVTVGRGMVGRRTKISAKGTVRVQFVHDAAIRAGGDIVVGNYLYNANLLAAGNVEIRKGEGVRGGGVWGGRTVALQSIEAWSVGSPSWIATELVAGFDPEAMEKRERVEEAIVKSSRHLNRILDVFKLSRLDPALIRGAIEQATGDRRRLLEQQARLLGQLATSYKALLEMRQGLVAEGADEKKTRSKITVRGTAYPEVTIRVKRQTLKLDREYDAVTFKQGEKGIETF
ncbi:MAG: FapA family protein [Desulfobulbaceae bacterium]|nr:FapA family protein [Desulfobulbaceae bacterium]